MVIKTIVTTDMIDVIAQKNQISCYNVLTGFKWIAELIKEKEGKEEYIIGGEESYGLMIGSQIRDKDAVSAVALICEMAAVEKNKGRSLYTRLLELYAQYGYFQEDLISITRKGMNGQQEIAQMMEDYRTNPPVELGGSKVTQLLDYQKQVRTILASGKTEPIKPSKIKRTSVYYRRRKQGKCTAFRHGAKNKILFQCTGPTGKRRKVSTSPVKSKGKNSKNQAGTEIVLSSFTNYKNKLTVFS
jgi:hypothetical protein